MLVGIKTLEKIARNYLIKDLDYTDQLVSECFCILYKQCDNDSVYEKVLIGLCKVLFHNNQKKVK